eukprot:3839117-Prorocentrum_lima.AAC.1
MAVPAANDVPVVLIAATKVLCRLPDLAPPAQVLRGLRNASPIGRSVWAGIAQGSPDSFERQSGYNGSELRERSSG